MAVPVPEATHLPRADGMLAALVHVVVWGVSSHVQNLLGCYECLPSIKAEPLLSTSLNEVCRIASTAVARASLDDCCKSAAVIVFVL